MKIVYFGIPDLGLICLNALIEKTKNIIAVVPPAPTHPTFPHMVSQAQEQGLNILAFEKSPNEESFLSKMRALEPDLAVVCAFDHKLSPELLKIPKLGVINCHPSLLPNYRGGNPYFHVIVNDEKKTGVTVHYMDENFDTGNIIAQKEIEIFPNETLGTLFHRLNFLCADMICNVVQKIEAGESLPSIEQDKTGNYPLAPKIIQEKGHTAIDWNKDASYIEKFTRACNPLFGSITSYRGCMIKIWAGTFLETEVKEKPGTIISVTSNGIGIATGKGVFVPTSMQVGYFFNVDSKDFVKRLNPQIGEMFLS